jgi:hypothetical protein
LGAAFGKWRTLVTGYSAREKADFDAGAADFLPQSLVTQTGFLTKPNE